MVGKGHRAAVSLPRLVVAAPASGHGKTTVATGLMAALRRAGHEVSGHKVGPDYIDPGYHALATGRPGRNLDPHLVGEERLQPLLLHGAESADIAIVEGVMGLYDGQIGGNGFASTAHVATVTRSPVVLVVDISHASRSIAAVVQGMVTYDPTVDVVGVILNKAGSQRHADEVCRALEPTGLPVLGVLHRDDGIVAPSRHLGLVPAAERDDAAHALDRLADRIAGAIDLEQIARLAREAPDLDDSPWTPDLEPASDRRPVVAVAGGRAFTFRYAETTELLAAAGCEVVTFDPLTDEALPEGTAGLYLGGGFPEVHAAGLSANAPLRAALLEAVQAGVPTVAECAGLLYLCRTVDGAPMVGAIDADAHMTPKLTLAYRTVITPKDHLLATAGTEIRGHEFHRTVVEPAGDIATDTLHASYLHTHWAGQPDMARCFAAAAHATVPAISKGSMAVNLREHTVVEPVETTNPLRYHGDAELADGLVDFAVNVHDGPRPEWLDAALRASLDDVGSYPHPGEAEAALARRHGRDPSEVLATAGAAEAFALIARARDWTRPVVVHPQFTEPGVALTVAGHPPEHMLLDADTGFTLDPNLVPEDADLVIVGNPTNPTSVLHPESTLRALARPGRVLVVDEAFMDSLPGEHHSLSSARIPGVVVIRSLTKLWSIPGVRAGYVLAEPALIAQLREQQSPWSVSTTAAAAMVACAGEEAVAESAARATRLIQHRTVLVDGLNELGIEVVADPAGPFVLARVGEGVHARIRSAGYAVRRADTFPGLDTAWVRIAVRRPDTTRKLLAVLRTEGAQ
ncbi:cobyrinate a,c-diamide synthase [Aeromicrobium sp.]|uniref:cobyrinate a,c-diamide synthase n=1 Tax=Aeromicrobium sp. TaxID=1871063 RepID=UPI003D6B20C9